MLLIAHRLSTVTAADRIVVLDAGRVRATGAHGDLVGADPLYSELAATQLLTPTEGDPAGPVGDWVRQGQSVRPRHGETVGGSWSSPWER